MDYVCDPFKKTAETSQRFGILNMTRSELRKVTFLKSTDRSRVWSFCQSVWHILTQIWKRNQPGRIAGSVASVLFEFALGNASDGKRRSK